MSTYQTLLTNARILDGTGNPWFYGDLAIQDDHIAEIAPPHSLQSAPQTINLEGRYLAPGFIDIHTHSDLSILVNRRAESAIRQGITTQVIGNCGMSPAPMDDAHLDIMKDYWGQISDQPEVSWGWHTFGEYLQALEEDETSINLAALVGHASLRISTMGMDDRLPTTSELNQMKHLLRDSMAAGAFGMSTGLVYPPGCYASTEEIIDLCRVLARYHGLYASHIRGERETILEAVAEAIHIGQQAGVPVHISHNAPKYGAPQPASANLRLVEEARARGQDVTVDNDVHTDLGPALFEGLPQELHELPIDQVSALLRNPDSRQQIKEEIIRDQKPAFGPVGLLKHAQWHRITLLHAPNTPQYLGCTLQAIAQQRGQDDPFETYFDLIIANGHRAAAIFDYIDPADIRTLLQHPAVMICSDGEALAPYGFLNDPPPYSPCSYGEFPGVLERFVRDDPVLTLEATIRKMTSFPASRLGLSNKKDHIRGILRPGAQADLVVFDLDRIHDRATNLYPHTFPFENYPHRYPEGIDYVFVSGELVVSNGEHTGALPGKVLRHPG